ncbi:mitochondrial transcription rescue factor 1-like [Penaeus japonicus]|uniref:mitochondrial transcription rescue factor 1-like n=1 Tax=Penaeus japonicus TaxID=27405 RepID=UPI001C70F105|nr:mitochondrial transcription rescue factor 1-like [Penaeus japonicus]
MPQSAETLRAGRRTTTQLKETSGTMWKKLCNHLVCRARLPPLSPQALKNSLYRPPRLACPPSRSLSSASFGIFATGSWPRHFGLEQGMTRVQGHTGSSSLAFLSRHKSSRSNRNKNRSQNFSDDEESDEEGELESAADFRDIRVNVPSLRLDAILKAGLNMSRNKVEAAFYDSKIRVNGLKVMKKSKQLQEEDEVDIIKSVSSKNPAFLDIARVVVLSIGNYNEETDKVQVRLRKYPNLLVEKYEDEFEKPS